MPFRNGYCSAPGRLPAVLAPGFGGGAFQGLEDRTGPIGTTRHTLGNQMLEGHAVPPELPDLPLHIADLSRRLFPDTETGPAGGRAQGEQLGDFMQRKPQRFGFLDEPEPPEIGVCVHPISRSAPRRGGQKPLSLIKPDGRDPDTGGARQFADEERSRHEILPPGA